MMKKNLLINLPEDVFINNILLSKVLPIKSLLSLRCVCKYLRNLITSPAFIKMQLHHSTTTNQLLLSNNNQSVLIRATNHPNVFFSLKFNGADPCSPKVVEFVSPIESSYISGSCNGLLCLTKKQDIVCLWNPFTKEYKVLPPPLPTTEVVSVGGIDMKVSQAMLGLLTYGFVYDRLLDDYKVIRCSQHVVEQLDYNDDCIPITVFQVYTLGANTWRMISTDNNPYTSYFVLTLLPSMLSSIVFVNGALHWIMSKSKWCGWKSESSRRRTLAEVKIVSLDIEKQVFGEMETPLLAKSGPHVPEIQVLRGCICVIELDLSTENSCNVWMMMDYGMEGSWTKLFTIVRKEVLPYTAMSLTYKLLKFCENGTEVIVKSNHLLLVYDLINNETKQVELGGKIGYYMNQSEVYIESLVSLNSGVYKGERRIQSKTRTRSKKKKKVSQLAH